MLQFEPSSIQNILIALVVICAIVYGFIEFRKINTKLHELEATLSKISDKESSMVKTMNDYEAPDEAMNSYGQTHEGYVNDTEESYTEVNHVTNEVEEYDDAEYDSLTNTHESSINNTVVGPVDIDPVDIDPIMMNKIINQVELSEPEIITSHEDKVITNEGTTAEDVVSEASYSQSDGLFISVAKDTLSPDPETPPPTATTSLPPPLPPLPPTTMDITTISTKYDEFTIKELKDTLTDLDLPTSGNKVKLIQRILSNNK